MMTLICKWYRPHDDPDKFHDDFVETLKEVDHDPSFLSHLANDDAERNTKHDDTYDTQRRVGTGSKKLTRQR